MDRLRLGVNIDHVATLRNARGGFWPDPVAAARLAEEAGADGITAHLREDRRHIKDADMAALKEQISLPLNFEMGATDEMVAIACRIKPNACCLVPENRAEITTEGGLEVAGQKPRLAAVTDQLKGQGMRVSLFIEAEEKQITAAAEIGADIVELHTGRYCDLPAGPDRIKASLDIARGAALAEAAGMEVHAGHGLGYDTVGPIAAIPQIVELNIGHFLIGAAIFSGLEGAIAEMRRLMEAARQPDRKA